jgi:hypothetical protein
MDPAEEPITDYIQLDPDKLNAYADYLKWQFQERVELIRGKLFRMSPAPGSRLLTCGCPFQKAKSPTPSFSPAFASFGDRPRRGFSGVRGLCSSFNRGDFPLYTQDSPLFYYFGVFRIKLLQIFLQ